MRRLSERERRLLAVGLLVLVVALAWLAVAAPIIGGFEARAEERRLLRATLARNERLLASLPQLRRRAEAQRREAGRYALPQADPAQAREALKARLAATLAAGGGEVRSVQDADGERPAGWVGARADATVTLSQLHDSLERLGNEEPYVVIEYLSIGADRAFTTGVSGPLDVRVEVAAQHRAALATRP